jgi:hypothetical protein
VLLVGCGGSTNDPVAREALIQASLRSAAAKSYVAVVGNPGSAAVTFTYVAPDRLRVQQGNGRSAVVFVQVALAGYHSDPKHPGRYTKRLENAAPNESAPLNSVSDLIARGSHYSRKGAAFRFDVAYGTLTVHVLVHVNAEGRIADADLPVFDKERKVVASKRVTFNQYGRAPSVAAPEASLIARG